MSQDIEGVTKPELFSCKICGAIYPTFEGAKVCFSKGLPQILKPGTTYHRKSLLKEIGEEYFLIHFTSAGEKPEQKTHRRNYVVSTFPERIGNFYEFVEATASFDGEFLDSIRGEYPRGRSIDIGRVKAVRLSESQLTELLKNPEFKRLHDSTKSYRE